MVASGRTSFSGSDDAAVSVHGAAEPSLHTLRRIVELVEDHFGFDSDYRQLPTSLSAPPSEMKMANRMTSTEAGAVGGEPAVMGIPPPDVEEDTHSVRLRGPTVMLDRASNFAPISPDEDTDASGARRNGRCLPTQRPDRHGWPGPDRHAARSADAAAGRTDEQKHDARRDGPRCILVSRRPGPRGMPQGTMQSISRRGGRAVGHRSSTYRCRCSLGSPRPLSCAATARSACRQPTGSFYDEATALVVDGAGVVSSLRPNGRQRSRRSRRWRSCSSPCANSISSVAQTVHTPPPRSLPCSPRSHDLLVRRYPRSYSMLHSRAVENRSWPHLRRFLPPAAMPGSSMPPHALARNSRSAWQLHC